MTAPRGRGVGGPRMCSAAAVIRRSKSGGRWVAVPPPLAGPGKRAARRGEPLTGVAVPLPPAATGSCYARLEYRQQMEIAVVGATALVTLAGDRVSAAKLAITALAPTVRLVPAAEEALVGSDGGRAAAEPAAQAAAEAREPISAVRASAEYRRAMAAGLARAAISAAAAPPRSV